IMTEYEETLEKLGKKMKMDNSSLGEWKILFWQRCEVIEPGKWIELCRDPADQKFLNVAATVGASYLISGDKDLLELKEKFPIPIVSPRDFLKRRK
ncbi:putative toxin-antitoxin system toxin component, PIN family, partial [Candidatus Riflebacteria bacterium]